jgi:Bacterial mobilisation protein (MobC)
VAQKPRRPPFSIRLSDAQRADIDSRADRAGLSAGGYAISTIFNTPPPRQSRRPTTDQQLLAQILTAFGKIGSNINQLARVANAGSWPDSRLLKQACDDIRMIRDMLIRALGLTPPDDPPPPGP